MANERNALAELAKELSQLPNDNFCVTTWDEENHYLVKEPTENVRAALIAYASMVERCEEVIADVNGPNSRFDHGIATPDFDANEIVDYILKGSKDEH